LYSKYKRFSLENYRYQSAEKITVAKENKGILLNYYKAIEAVNGYVIRQWSTYSIDVRHPKKDNELTKAAVASKIIKK